MLPKTNKVHKLKKEEKNKPHAILQTMNKIPLNFKKAQNVIVRGVALTKYPIIASEMQKNDFVHKLKIMREKII